MNIQSYETSQQVRDEEGKKKIINYSFIIMESANPCLTEIHPKHPKWWANKNKKHDLICYWAPNKYTFLRKQIVMSEMSRKTTRNKRRKKKEKIGNVKISFYFENSVADTTTATTKRSLKVNLCVELKDYWTI